MILKSLSRKSDTACQLLKYILRYVSHTKENTNGGLNTKPFIIKHNIRGRSVKRYIQEFKENEVFRLVHRKDSVKIFHTILSLSKHDRQNITDAMLRDIADEFIKQRGENNLYIGTKHEDKAHIHLHLAVSGTQLNGRSSRVSKQKFHSIKLALDRFQREKYSAELAHSFPDHGKAKKVHKEQLVERFKANRQNDKAIILTKLNELFNSATSQQDFYEKVAAHGYPVYYRAGKPQGIIHHRKFRFNRLGFHDELLLGLDGKSKQQALDTLQQLRKGNTRQQAQEKGQATAKGVLTNEKPMLSTLQSLRAKGVEKEQEESKDLHIEPNNTSFPKRLFPMLSSDVETEGVTGTLPVALPVR